MSHLRHSGPAPVPVSAPAPAPALAPASASTPLTPRSPLVALPATAPEIDAGSSTFVSNFSSPSGALGLHISSSSSSASTSSPPSYSPHAVISLGEEWTDQDTSSDGSASLDVFGDSESYFAFSPTSSASSLSPELTTEQLPLWQAEHARLLSIRDAVLSSERATRYREACLESEVARIKDDLARVKEARTRARWVAVASRVGSSLRRNSAPDASQGEPSTSTPTPLVRRASDSDVAAHQHAAERQWQQHSSTRSWFSDDDEEEEEEPIAIDDELPVPTESMGQFWDEDYPDPEMMLANNLIEARSARAEERRKRKRDHERIRELGILLSLGSEVRQWEERLAWETAFQNDSMELDHVEDPACRRRSKSLPTTPASGGSSVDSSSFSSSSALASPLPPLSASPLWRVSAEMILRRRSLSERPRRATPVITVPFTHETGVPVDASTCSGSNDSGSNSSSSAKRLVVPPPISITSTSFASSLKTAPSRPSALKLSFTLEDLVAPEEAAVIEKIEENTREDEEMCNSSEESSDASDSDDSRCKSSSSNSSSSENENEREGEKRLALRRGRSRWSWRRSLQSAQQQQLQQQLQQIIVDMEVDDA